MSEEYQPTLKSAFAVNAVETNGVEKYLVVCCHDLLYKLRQLQEFTSNLEIEILQNKNKMEGCDLLCFVYDSSDPNSFAYIANLCVCYIYQPLLINQLKCQFSGHTPILFISTKSDMDLVPQVSLVMNSILIIEI